MLCVSSFRSAVSGPAQGVVMNLFFLCRPYATGHSSYKTKTHKNYNDSFSSLGSSLTKRSGRYDDNKNSFNEIPVPSQSTNYIS